MSDWVDAAQQQRLTGFLDQLILWERTPVLGYPLYGQRRLPLALHLSPAQRGAPRPTAEELARELLAIAEFEALRLGSFLATPDGELLVAAVEAVEPPFYKDDTELLVAALKLAAEIQQRRVRVGGLLLGAAAAVVLTGAARSA